MAKLTIKELKKVSEMTDEQIIPIEVVHEKGKKYYICLCKRYIE